MKKQEKIEKRKQKIGSRNHRKLKRYSDKFNEMFNFFYRSSYCGILSFCGSNINIQYSQDAPDAKFCFRKFENGHKDWNVTCHPNVLFHAICGKKGFGLWVQQWSQGIAECNFSKNEIIKEFERESLIVPDKLMKSFEDFIEKEKVKRCERELEKIF